MNLNFTPQARADLEAIHSYIARDNLIAAVSVIQRILQAIAILEKFPLLGRAGEVSDTREFSIANLPYFAVYEIVDESQLDIITILHTSRQYLPPAET